MIEFLVSALASLAASVVRDLVRWVCASVRARIKILKALHCKP